MAPASPSEGKTISEACRWLLLSSYFFTSLAYAVIIPASWSISEAAKVGHSAAWSGALISFFYASSVVGMVAFRRLREGSYIQSLPYKPLFCYPCLLRAITNVVFVSVLISSDINALSACILLACRLVDGALNACQTLCALEMLAITSRDRVHMIAMIGLLANMGLGGGMLLASALDRGFLDGLWALIGVPILWQSVPGASPTLFMIFFWILAFLVTTLVMEQDDPIAQEEHMPLYTPARAPTTRATRKAVVCAGTDHVFIRKSVICAGILFLTSRAFVNSGIDAASVMILETQWDWTRAQAASAVGCCYLTSIIWHGAFQFLRIRLGVADATLMHAGVSILAIAALGLFNSSSHEATNVALLLISDCIMFPLFLLTASICLALVTRSCVLNDATWGLETIIFLQKVIVECVGFTLGPIAARSMLAGPGRNHYALMQLVCILAAASAWFLLINPGYKKLEGNIAEQEHAFVKQCSEQVDFPSAFVRACSS